MPTPALGRGDGVAAVTDQVAPQVGGSIPSTARSSWSACSEGSGPLGSIGIQLKKVERCSAVPSGRSSGRSSSWEADQDEEQHGPKKLQPHHEQAVAYFFAHAPEATRKGQPLRFHMAGGRTAVYGTIISLDLKTHWRGCYAVFLPDEVSAKRVADELRGIGLDVEVVGEHTSLREDASVYVSCYEFAKSLTWRDFRIKVVEETGQPLAASAGFVSVRQVSAELVVHFAQIAHGHKPSGRNALRSQVAPRKEEELNRSWMDMFTKPYDILWKAFIRPPRASYALEDLGIDSFVFGNHVFERHDVQLTNPRGFSLECSHFFMKGGMAMRQLCVVYLHGNCSSRLEAFYVLPFLLTRGLSVFTLDLAGCGWSGGEYVSLGHHEEQDVRVALDYLRSAGMATAVALWGRSMGAVAAIRRAAKDPDIAACVLDSPFSDLSIVVEEYVGRLKFPVPSLLLGAVLSRIRSEIKSRADFDLDDLVPLRSACKATSPALFSVAKDDTFILPHHTTDLYNAWAGERSLVQFDGGHGGKRPAWFLDQASDFLLDRLSSWSREVDMEGEEVIKGSRRRVFVL